MSIAIAGTLYDPMGNEARFTDIKLITLQGSLTVIESSNAVYRTDELGAYSFSVEFGRFAVLMRYNGNNGAYEKIQSITVNSDTVASTLEELLAYTEPLTPAEILIVQALVAEATAAKDDAEAAAIAAALSADESAASAAAALVSENAAANSVALLAPVPLNGGVWASGQEYNSYNEYMIFGGEAYSPLSATTLPYTVGATPHLGLVYQIKLNDASTLANFGVTTAIYADLTFESLSDAVNSDLISEGNTISLKERVLGGSGGGMWDVVLASSVTPNTFNIVQCVTAPDLALVLRFDGAANPKQFGAAANGIDSDSPTLDFMADLLRGGRVQLDWGESTYNIRSTLDLSRLDMVSNGAVIRKEFQGVGVVIDSAIDITWLTGELEVHGYGVGESNLTAPSTRASDHGVRISGRTRIDGRFIANFNAGNGFLVSTTAAANMNRCKLNALWANNNGVRGVRFSSARDDCAVWEVYTATFGNYEGGVLVDPGYHGRSWDWYCYNESSVSATGTGVFIGKLRTSSVFVYSEETGSSGAELLIDSECSNLDILDARSNRTSNFSPETCITRNGATKTYRGGSGGIVDSEVFENLIDSSASVLTKVQRGSLSSTITTETIIGSGGWEKRVQNRDTATQFYSLGMRTNYAYAEGYTASGKAILHIRSNKGTPSTPITLSSGDDFSEIQGILYANGGDAVGYKIRGNAKVVGGGIRSNTDLIFSVAQGNSFATDRMTLLDTGVLNVPAGVTPFTGMHIGRSDIEIQNGLAVDIVSVLRKEVTAKVNLPELVDIPKGDEEAIKKALDYNRAVESIIQNYEPTTYEQTTPIVEPSKAAKSKVCAGVVEQCVLREDGKYDVYIAAVGDNSTTELNGFKVCDEGGAIEAGDILCTSSTEGYLMKMPDNTPESACRFKAMESAVFNDGKAEVYGYFK